MKFDFSKSSDPDFRNKLQLQLDTLMKNVLYITYRIDTLVSDMKKLTVDKGLQKQVDDYFEVSQEEVNELEEQKDLD